MAFENPFSWGGTPETSSSDASSANLLYDGTSAPQPVSTGDTDTWEHYRATRQAESYGHGEYMKVLGRSLSVDLLNGSDAGKQLLKVREANDRGRRGFLEAVTDFQVSDIPLFVGDIVGTTLSIKDTYKASDTLESIMKGEEVDTDDLVKAALLLEVQERQSMNTKGGIAGDIARSMPGYMVETGVWLAATAAGAKAFGLGTAVSSPVGGVAAATVAAGTTLGRRALVKYAATKAGKAAAKFLASTAGKTFAKASLYGLAGVAEGTAHTVMDTALDAAANTIMGRDPLSSRAGAENMVNQVLVEGETDEAKANMIALGTEWTERMSEQMGASFGVALAPLGKKIASVAGRAAPDSGATAAGTLANLLGDAANREWGTAAKVAAKAKSSAAMKLAKAQTPDIAEDALKAIGAKAAKLSMGEARKELLEKGATQAMKEGLARKQRVALAGAWLADKAADSLDKYPLEVVLGKLKRVGYDGYVEEMMEERWSGLVNGLLGLEGDEASIKNGLTNMWWDNSDQFWGEAIGFAMPLAVVGAAHRGRLAVAGNNMTEFTENVRTVQNGLLHTANADSWFEFSEEGLADAANRLEAVGSPQETLDAVKKLSEAARNKPTGFLGRAADYAFMLAESLATGSLAGHSGYRMADSILAEAGTTPMIETYTRMYDNAYDKAVRVRKIPADATPEARAAAEAEAAEEAAAFADRGMLDAIGNLRGTKVIQKSILDELGISKDISGDELTMQLNKMAAEKDSPVMRTEVDLNGVQQTVFSLKADGLPGIAQAKAARDVMAEALLSHGINNQVLQVHENGELPALTMGNDMGWTPQDLRDIAANPLTLAGWQFAALAAIDSSGDGSLGFFDRVSESAGRMAEMIELGTSDVYSVRDGAVNLAIARNADGGLTITGGNARTDADIHSTGTGLGRVVAAATARQNDMRSSQDPSRQAGQQKPFDYSISQLGTLYADQGGLQKADRVVHVVPFSSIQAPTALRLLQWAQKVGQYGIENEDVSADRGDPNRPRVAADFERIAKAKLGAIKEPRTGQWTVGNPGINSYDPATNTSHVYVSPALRGSQATGYDIWEEILESTLKAVQGTSAVTWTPAMKAYFTNAAEKLGDIPRTDPLHKVAKTLQSLLLSNNSIETIGKLYGTLRLGHRDVAQTGGYRDAITQLEPILKAVPGYAAFVSEVDRIHGAPTGVTSSAQTVAALTPWRPFGMSREEAAIQYAPVKETPDTRTRDTDTVAAAPEEVEEPETEEPETEEPEGKPKTKGKAKRKKATPKPRKRRAKKATAEKSAAEVLAGTKPKPGASALESVLGAVNKTEGPSPKPKPGAESDEGVSASLSAFRGAVSDNPALLVGTLEVLAGQGYSPDEMLAQMAHWGLSPEDIRALAKEYEQRRKGQHADGDDTAELEEQESTDGGETANKASEYQQDADIDFGSDDKMKKLLTTGPVGVYKQVASLALGSSGSMHALVDLMDVLRKSKGVLTGSDLRSGADTASALSSAQALVDFVDTKNEALSSALAEARSSETDIRAAAKILALLGDGAVRSIGHALHMSGEQVTAELVVRMDAESEMQGVSYLRYHSDGAGPIVARMRSAIEGTLRSDAGREDFGTALVAIATARKSKNILDEANAVVDALEVVAGPDYRGHLERLRAQLPTDKALRDTIGGALSFMLRGVVAKRLAEGKASPAELAAMIVDGRRAGAPGKFRDVVSILRRAVESILPDRPATTAFKPGGAMVYNVRLHSALKDIMEQALATPKFKDVELVELLGARFQEPDEHEGFARDIGIDDSDLTADQRESLMRAVYKHVVEDGKGGIPVGFAGGPQKKGKVLYIPFFGEKDVMLGVFMPSSVVEGAEDFEAAEALMEQYYFEMLPKAWGDLSVANFAKRVAALNSGGTPPMFGVPGGFEEPATFDADGNRLTAGDGSTFVFVADEPLGLDGHDYTTDEYGRKLAVSTGRPNKKVHKSHTWHLDLATGATMFLKTKTGLGNTWEGTDTFEKALMASVEGSDVRIDRFTDADGAKLATGFPASQTQRHSIDVDGRTIEGTIYEIPTEASIETTNLNKSSTASDGLIPKPVINDSVSNHGAADAIHHAANTVNNLVEFVLRETDLTLDDIDSSGDLAEIMRDDYISETLSANPDTEGLPQFTSQIVATRIARLRSVAMKMAGMNVSSKVMPPGGAMTKLSEVEAEAVSTSEDPNIWVPQPDGTYARRDRDGKVFQIRWAGSADEALAPMRVDESGRTIPEKDRLNVRTPADAPSVYRFAEGVLKPGTNDPMTMLNNYGEALRALAEARAEGTGTDVNNAGESLVLAAKLIALNLDIVDPNSGVIGEWSDKRPPMLADLYDRNHKLRDYLLTENEDGTVTIPGQVHETSRTPGGPSAHRVATVGGPVYFEGGQPGSVGMDKQHPEGLAKSGADMDGDSQSNQMHYMDKFGAIMRHIPSNDEIRTRLEALKANPEKLRSHITSLIDTARKVAANELLDANIEAQERMTPEQRQEMIEVEALHEVSVAVPQDMVVDGKEYKAGTRMGLREYKKLEAAQVSEGAARDPKVRRAYEKLVRESTRARGIGVWMYNGLQDLVYLSGAGVFADTEIRSGDVTIKMDADPIGYQDSYKHVRSVLGNIINIIIDDIKYGVAGLLHLNESDLVTVVTMLMMKNHDSVEDVVEHFQQVVDYMNTPLVKHMQQARRRSPLDPYRKDTDVDTAGASTKLMRELGYTDKATFQADLDSYATVTSVSEQISGALSAQAMYHKKPSSVARFIDQSRLLTKLSAEPTEDFEPAEGVRAEFVPMSPDMGSRAYDKAISMARLLRSNVYNELPENTPYYHNAVASMRYRTLDIKSITKKSEVLQEPTLGQKVALGELLREAAAIEPLARKLPAAELRAIASRLEGPGLKFAGDSAPHKLGYNQRNAPAAVVNAVIAAVYDRARELEIPNAFLSSVYLQDGLLPVVRRMNTRTGDARLFASVSPANLSEDELSEVRKSFADLATMFVGDEYIDIYDGIKIETKNIPWYFMASAVMSYGTSSSATRGNPFQFFDAGHLGEYAVASGDFVTEVLRSDSELWKHYGSAFLSPTGQKVSIAGVKGKVGLYRPRGAANYGNGGSVIIRSAFTPPAAGSKNTIPGADKAGQLMRGADIEELEAQEAADVVELAGNTIELPEAPVPEQEPIAAEPVVVPPEVPEQEAVRMLYAGTGDDIVERPYTDAERARFDDLYIRARLQPSDALRARYDRLDYAQEEAYDNGNVPMQDALQVEKEVIEVVIAERAEASKPAVKKEATATTPVPTTAEKVSREEIGEGSLSERWSAAELWAPEMLGKELAKYGGEAAWVNYRLAPASDQNKPVMQGTMYFKYGKKDPGAKHGSTFEAIKAGARTSTTRYKAWPQYQKYSALKSGDVVRFWSGNKVGQGEFVDVVVDSVQKIASADVVEVQSVFPPSMYDDFSPELMSVLEFLLTQRNYTPHTQAQTDAEAEILPKVDKLSSQDWKDFNSILRDIGYTRASESDWDRSSFYTIFDTLGNDELSRYVTGESASSASSGKPITLEGYHYSEEADPQFREHPEGYAAQRGVDPRAIFFAGQPATEASFLSKRPYVQQYALRMENPLVVDGVLKAEESTDQRMAIIKSLVDTAIKAGHDGIILRDVWDNMMQGDVFIVFSRGSVRATENTPAGQFSSGYGEEVTTLDENQVFVFGSNLGGFHGAGSAGYASFNEPGNVWRKHDYGKKPNGWQGKWNIKGRGEGLQQGTEGTSYALPTVTKAGAKLSRTKAQITESIRKMYDVARNDPSRTYLVAGSTARRGLNGYSHEAMAGMYRDAGPIPGNVVFSNSYTALVRPTATQQEPTADVQETPAVAPVIQELRDRFGGDVAVAQREAAGLPPAAAASPNTPLAAVAELPEPRMHPTATVNIRGREVPATVGQAAALDQLDAFFATEGHATIVIKGPAGSGKTAIAKSAMRSVPAGSIIIGGAPTHKARVVLGKSIGRNVDVFTVAGLVGKTRDILTNMFVRGGAESPFDGADVAVIDEASMIVERDLRAILSEAIKYGVKLVFMGDPKQLPPIRKRGSKFDGMPAPAFTRFPNVVELTDIMRQGLGNPLLALATVLRGGTRLIESLRERVSELNGKGEGVKYYNDSAEFLASVVEEAKAGMAEGDPQRGRVVSYRVKTQAAWARKIADALFPGAQAGELREGMLVTGYDNRKANRDEFHIINSADYVVTSIGEPEITSGMTTRVVRFKPIDTIDDKTQFRSPAIRIVEAESHDAFAARVNELLSTAKAAHGKARSQAWKAYFRFVESYASTRPVLLDSIGREDVAMALKAGIKKLQDKSELSPEERQDLQELLLEEANLSSNDMVALKSIVQPGYAITAHKAQGSTYDSVYIDEADIDTMRDKDEMLQLKYTAVTRARNTAHMLSPTTAPTNVAQVAASEMPTSFTVTVGDRTFAVEQLDNGSWVAREGDVVTPITPERALSAWDSSIEKVVEPPSAAPANVSQEDRAALNSIDIDPNQPSSAADEFLGPVTASLAHARSFDELATQTARATIPNRNKNYDDGVANKSLAAKLKRILEKAKEAGPSVRSIDVLDRMDAAVEDAGGVLAEWRKQDILQAVDALKRGTTVPRPTDSKMQRAAIEVDAAAEIDYEESRGVDRDVLEDLGYPVQFAETAETYHRNLYNPAVAENRGGLIPDHVRKPDGGNLQPGLGLSASLGSTWRVAVLRYGSVNTAVGPTVHAQIARDLNWMENFQAKWSRKIGYGMVYRGLDGNIHDLVDTELEFGGKSRELKRRKWGSKFRIGTKMAKQDHQDLLTLDTVLNMALEFLPNAAEYTREDLAKAIQAASAYTGVSIDNDAVIRSLLPSHADELIRRRDQVKANVRAAHAPTKEQIAAADRIDALIARGKRVSKSQVAFLNSVRNDPLDRPEVQMKLVEAYREAKIANYRVTEFTQRDGAGGLTVKQVPSSIVWTVPGHLAYMVYNHGAPNESGQFDTTKTSGALQMLLDHGRTREGLDPLELLKQSRLDYDAMRAEVNEHVPYIASDDGIYVHSRDKYTGHYTGALGFTGNLEASLLDELKVVIDAASRDTVKESQRILGLSRNKQGQAKPISSATDRMLEFLFELKGLEYVSREHALERIKNADDAADMQMAGLHSRMTYADASLEIRRELEQKLLERALAKEGGVDAPVGSVASPAGIIRAVDKAKFEVREFSPRTLARTYVTFDDLYRETGKLPANIGILDGLQRYSSDVSAKAALRASMNTVATTLAPDGMPAVLFDPDLDFEGSDQESALTEAVWRFQADAIATAYGETLDTALTAKQNLQRLIHKHVTKSDTYSEIDSPFPSVMKMYGLTKGVSEENYLDMMSGGEVSALMKHALKTKFDGPGDIFKRAEVVNNTAKMLAMQGSLFFFIAGLEGYTAGTAGKGLTNKMVPFWKIRQLVKARHPELMHILELAESMGLTTGQMDNQAALPQHFDRPALQKIEQFARQHFGEDTARWAKHLAGTPGKYTETMFDSWLSSAKLAMFISHYQSMEAKAAAAGVKFNPKRDMKWVVRYLDNELGGMRYVRYSWLTPSTRRMSNLLMFSFPWTLAAWNAAGGGLISGPLLKNYVSPEEAKFIVTRRLPMMMFGILMVLPAVAQMAAFVGGKALAGLGMGGDGDDDDDELFMWNNETGRKRHADITPLIRNMPWYSGDPTGKRRFYLRWGKQLYEVQRWFEDPFSAFSGKLSLGARWALEQATGSVPGYDWDLPFKDQGLLGLVVDKDGSIAGSRLGHTISKFLPFSMLAWARTPDAAPAHLLAPVSKGVSYSRSVAAYEGLLRTWARKDTYSKIYNNRRVKARLESLGSEILQAAEKNGYNSEKVLETARAAVAKDIYRDLFDAINSEDTKGAEEAARQLHRINGKVSGAKASVRGKNRNRNLPSRLTPEQREAINEAFDRP